MKRISLISLCLLILIGNSIQANEVAPKQAESKQMAAADNFVAIEREALAVLDKMSSYLAKQKLFEVTSNITMDEVLIDNDQKIQLHKTVSLKVDRPGKLFIEEESTRNHRQYFFNGEQFTIYGPENHYYANFDAPATIGKLLDVAETKYNLKPPLSDLFVWGTDQSDNQRLTGALVIGLSEVDGKSCTHLAFREKDKDWQLWVEDGDQPLPCQLTITSTGVVGHPQYSATYTWKFPESLAADNFLFKPAAEDHPIALLEVDINVKEMTKE